MFLGEESLKTSLSMILQRFSTGLRSGELASHSVLATKFGRNLPHHAWVAFAVWAGAPSCMYKRHLLVRAEQFSLVYSFCCTSAA